MTTPAKVLIVPGLYGSGPDQWQSHWERRHPEFKRVEQADWETPNCLDWTSVLDAAIRQQNDNVILVGHSLGSVAIAHWALRYRRKIAGALMVAPSDTEAEGFPKGTAGFAPIPTCPLEFPSIVVASTQDPYISFERIQQLASAWGSKLVALGAYGHISTADGFGPWTEGIAYLNELRSRSE